MSNVTTDQMLDLLRPRLDALGLLNDSVDVNTSLLDQGILDSMSFLEFVVDIEQKFGVELDFGDLDPSDFTSIYKLQLIINHGS